MALHLAHFLSLPTLTVLENTQQRVDFCIICVLMTLEYNKSLQNSVVKVTYFYL